MLKMALHIATGKFQGRQAYVFYGILNKIQKGKIMENQSLPPVKLAFIIDGEVVDILHTDERLAAIFTSQPLVMDVTDKLEIDSLSVVPGMTYDADLDKFISGE